MIVISKNKIHHEYIEGGLKVMVDLGSNDVSLTRFFADTVFVESDVTVEDVLRHLIDYQEDITYAMESSLGGHPLEIFLDELIADMPSEEHLTYAEFSHEVSEIDGYITYAPRFGAIGKEPIIDLIDEHQEEITYSIELAPIAAYMHLPIVLNREYVVIRTDIVDGKEVETTILTSMKDFTLYEFLHALLFEISYYGTPDQRAQTLKEVIASMGPDGVIENISVLQIEQMKGTEILRLELELEQSIANEDYEKSAEIRDQIAHIRRGGKSSATNLPPEV